MSWRYKLNACDTRLMRETWHHRQHDDTLGLVLPHHPPEIVNSVREGTLGGNIRTLASVTLSHERIVFGKG